MPKPFSRRIDGVLAAYKGAKPKKAKVTATKTGYENVDGSTFEGPFGSGSSTFGAPDPVTGKRSLNSSMTLSTPLKQAGDTAATGLNANLGYLQRDPSQQVASLTSGQDPMYNVLREQSQRAYDTNLGRARLDAQQGGGSNSTAAGATYGRLMGDKALIDNQNLLQTLGFNNQTATQNASTNLGAIGNLSQLVYPLGSAANAQLNTAIGGQDRAQASTAAAQNAADATYTAEMNKYRASQAAGLGGGIGSLVGTLGGAALGSFVPVIGTALGAKLGGAIGGKIGGGGNSMAIG